MSNTITKNTRLALPISPDYVSGWGFWEAVREFVQNALDSHDRGHEMSLERGRGKGRALKIRNRGADLQRDTLLLGTSSKRNDSSQRGQFGEGYKLAALVLCRLGFDVQIRTRHEMWDFEIAHSGEFGAETLHVKIRAASAQDYVEVRVTPPEVLDESEWDALWKLVLGRVIDIPALGTQIPDSDKVTNYRGSILLSPEHRGKLYCKGLFVCDLPDANYRFGYDLDVQLDRDRRMADPWSLRYAIATVVDLAVSSEKLSPETVVSMVTEQCAELRAFSDYSGSAINVARVCADHFRAVNGENAVPVSGYGEGEAFAHVNLKPIVVDRGLRALLETALGSNEARLASRKNEVKRTFQASELGEEAWDNLKWAAALIQRAVDFEFETDPIRVLDRLSVVEFRDDRILGMYGDGAIKVSSRIVDKSQAHKLVATLAHEVAHHYETSGDHATITENLLGRVIALSR